MFFRTVVYYFCVLYCVVGSKCNTLSCRPAFFLFVAISVRNLQLQSFAELSTLRELYTYNTFDIAQCGWKQCLRRLRGSQSSRQCGYWHSESHITLFGSITNIWFSPENSWTSKKHPLLFWFWHWSKSGWLNLTIT